MLNGKGISQLFRTACGGLGLIVALAAALAPVYKVEAAVSFAFDVEAPAALLMDFDSGQILFAKNEHAQRPPASIAKVMTLLLIMEAVQAGKADWTDLVTVSAEASRIGGSQVFLKQGERFSLEQMAKAITVASGNDAAVAVAEHLAGSQASFVDAMNQRAKELGMKNTQFINADGLPSESGQQENLTTAPDIAIMARELLKHPKILEWTSIRKERFRENPPLDLINTNRLIQVYPGADGLKTGHTSEAGYSLVGTAKRDDLRLISVVLGTNSDGDRLHQTTRLLDYGFNNFRKAIAAAENETVGKVRIRDGSPEEVDVVTPKAFRVLAPRGEQDKVERRFVPQKNLVAPVKKGENVGQLVAVLGGRELGSTEVTVARDVKRANPIVRFFRWIRDLIGGLF